LRVADIEASLAFYRALGYHVIGLVPGTGLGDLTMIALPDDPFVALELVHVPDETVEVRGISHLVIQVEDLDAFIARLEAGGISCENVAGGAGGPHTAWLTDPDGYRIELVQWPQGHPEGITESDFAGPSR